MKRGRYVALLLAAASAVTAGGPVAAAPGKAVTGAGGGVLFLPPFTGDRVTIVIEASGRFEVAHYDKLGQEFARLGGTITCVNVRGTTAFMTGTVDRGHAPEVVGDPRGMTFPITVADGTSFDMVGLAPPSQFTPPCSPVPLNTLIDEGNFTVS